MRRGYAMRKLERQHRRPAELLLVPMIDIFTVLVTFLLMTAVFSRTVIMELKLPTQSAAPVDLPPGAGARGGAAQDRAGGTGSQDRPAEELSGPHRHRALRSSGPGGFPAAGEGEVPEKTEATLLLEPDVPYDDLVQVMDTVRILEQRQGGRMVQAELFPDVSLGDAEVTARGPQP